MGELLIRRDVCHALSECRDVLGIQLLNYLFSYQEELGMWSFSTTIWNIKMCHFQSATGLGYEMSMNG